MKFSLPDYYVITDNNNDEDDIFLKKAKRCLDSGYQMIQLRKKTCSTENYNAYANILINLAALYRAKIILNHTTELCYPLAADGIHLTSQRLMSLDSRPLPETRIVSASCHDLIQLKHAETIGVDFVTVSPVLWTATHPEKEPLGWKLFEKYVRVTKLPVYALGGMEIKFLNKVKAIGGNGIAAIREFWS